MEAWMPWALTALLALAAWELRNIHYGLESRGWTHTVGVLAKVWVEDMPQVPVEGAPFHDEEGTHSVHARYAYKVGGRWHQASRVSYRTTHWVRFNEALDMIYGMRPGKEIDVWYDPDQPGRSVLITGSSTANAVLLSLYLVLAACMIFALMH
jgi:hypothetical protein